MNWRYGAATCDEGVELVEVHLDKDDVAEGHTVSPYFAASDKESLAKWLRQAADDVLANEIETGE